MIAPRITLVPQSYCLTASFANGVGRQSFSFRCSIPRFKRILSPSGLDAAKFKWFLEIYQLPDGEEMPPAVLEKNGMGAIRLSEDEEGDSELSEAVAWVFLRSDEFKALATALLAGLTVTRASLAIHGIEYGAAPDGSDVRWISGDSPTGIVVSFDYTLGQPHQTNEADDDAIAPPVSTNAGPDLALKSLSEKVGVITPLLFLILAGVTYLAFR